MLLLLDRATGPGWLVRNLTFSLFGIAANVYGQPTIAPVYAWQSTGPLDAARHSACVVALPDGRGLVAGGVGQSGALSSVELYQTDGTFIAGASLLHPRSRHSCTVLNDGRVLVVGGLGDSSPPAAEVYDPQADKWTELDTPGLPRWRHTATLLPSGGVLLAGGETDYGPTALLEVFNPFEDRIVLLDAKLSSPRKDHAAALLQDGSVLITGGSDGNRFLSSIDLYGVDGAVTYDLQLPESRTAHSATTLDDGRVLIVGGEGEAGELTSAWLYSPGDNTFQPASPLQLARSRHLAFLLPDNGGILVIGGIASGSATASTEVFDPTDGTFATVGSLTAARSNLSGAPMGQDGPVLVVGGLTENGPLATCGAFIAPTVSLDKALYSTGDTFNISGSHWANGENLTVSIDVFTFAGVDSASRVLSLSASATGTFQFSAPLSPLSAETAGGLINVRVTGATSHFTAITHSRQLDPTTTALGAFPTHVFTRQTVTLTANVRAAAALSSFFQGFVNFFDGNTLIGTASTIAFPPGTPGSPTTGSSYSFDVNGNNFFVLPAIPDSGPHTLKAAFTPFTPYLAASTATGPQILVDKRPVILSFDVTPTTVNVGESIFVSATVTPESGPPPIPNLPSGTVEMFADSPPAFTALPLSPRSGSGTSTAQANITSGPPGTLSLQAAYQGDSNYSLSKVENRSVTVNKGTLTLTLLPETTTHIVGEGINLTARIQHNAVPGGAATGTFTITPALPGSDNIFPVFPDPDNGTPLDTALSTVLQSAGAGQVIHVHYSGNSNWLPADAQVTVSVNKATPNIVTSLPPSLAAQLNFGGGFTYTAKVVPPGTLIAPPIPTGSLNVVLNPDSPTAPTPVRHCSSLNPSPPGAVCNLMEVATEYCPGDKVVFTFTYSGDTNYAGITFTQNVTMPYGGCFKP